MIAEEDKHEEDEEVVEEMELELGMEVDEGEEAACICRLTRVLTGMCSPLKWGSITLRGSID